MRKSLWIGLLMLCVSMPALAQSEGNFQIMKATEDKVWRLNTQTGEIAICQLRGDNLVCTNTSDAAAVPQKSYAQMEAEKEAEAAARAEAEAEQRERDLKLLDKILTFFKELIATALGSS